jgi:hypothetical protein
MKKLICSIIILAAAGFAHAEIPPLDNPGFESGMSGWSTWGSGSGSRGHRATGRQSTSATLIVPATPTVDRTL